MADDEYGYSIYELAGATPGRIVRNGRTDQSIQMMAQPVKDGEAFHPVFAETTTHYIDVVLGEVLPRPKYLNQFYTLLPDEELAVPVPNGTKVRFQAEDYIVDDGLFEFSSAIPGVYTFLITPTWPGQEQRVEIRV